MKQKLGCAAIGLSVIDVVCIYISLVTNCWAYTQAGAITGYAGLWRECVEVAADTTLCSDVKDNSDYMTVRAMLFLSLLFTCGAVACILLGISKQKEQKELLFGASGLYAAAGTSLMLGFTTYHATIFQSVKDINSSYELHAGFALCIVAWIVTWALAGLSVELAFVEEQRWVLINRNKSLNHSQVCL